MTKTFRLAFVNQQICVVFMEKSLCRETLSLMLYESTFNDSTHSAELKHESAPRNQRFKLKTHCLSMLRSIRGFAGFEEGSFAEGN